MILDRASPADHHCYRADDSGGDFENVIFVVDGDDENLENVNFVNIVTPDVVLLPVIIVVLLDLRYGVKP